MSRESVNDVGKEIQNPSSKKTVREIIHANSKRAEEALRVLSEYSQLLDPDSTVINILEEYRYEIYSIEKVLLKNEKLLRLHNSKLYLVTSRITASGQIIPDKDFFKIIGDSILGGIDIIQLREKAENEKRILELAREIKKLVNNSEVLFIINDRLDIALASDADGIHLGQDDLPLHEARKISPESFIIGLSTHSIEQGQAGLKTSADYLGVGPVFPTPTKPDYNPAGLEYVSWAHQNLKTLPWFAIGGIDESNIDKVINNGAQRIAVVRSIINSSNPLKLTKDLKGRFETTNLIHA